MAGDYLPMRLDLDEDPATIQIAAALDLDELDVVGRLWKVWAWGNRQLRDGNAPGVTPAWLDRYTHTPGLAEAMARVGWLDIDQTGGLAIPHFETWNGKAAKTRLSGAERQAKHRNKSRDRDANRNAGNVTPPQPKPLPQDSTEEESTGQDKSTDHIWVSLEDKDTQLQIRAIAAEQFRGAPFPEPHELRQDDRRDLLGIAAIHHAGAVKPAWLYTRLDAMRAAHQANPISRPVPYLKHALADYWPAAAEKRYGGFYKALYHVCEGIPAEMLIARKSPKDQQNKDQQSWPTETALPTKRDQLTEQNPMPTLVLTPTDGEVLVFRLPDGRRATVKTRRRSPASKRLRLVLDFPADVAIHREQADKEPAE